MKLSKQPYKGARDFYPEDKRIQKWMFAKLRSVVESFGYQEYDAPILEPFEIYAAKTGEEIVNTQLYSFEDRGGRKVAIRPEMTPTVSRMVAARRQELAYPLRLFNIGSRWRYERPQRGRNREFFQLDVDLFGVENVEADAEIIQVADSILKAFGAKPDSYKIRVNSLKGAAEVYDSLKLDKATQQAVSKLLDKRAKMSEETFKGNLVETVGPDMSEKLLDFWAKEAPPANVAKLMKLLKASGVSSAIFDPEIVRGFDYYTDVVFEVFDESAENNRSMFGGGRYDGLVGLFGVEPVPTIGFAVGDVTLQNFLEANKLIPELPTETDAAVLLIGDVYDSAQDFLAKLRDQGLNLAVDATDRKLDSKIKNAVKGGVKVAIFIGEQELKDKKFKLKDLESGEEILKTVDEIAEDIKGRRV